MLLLKIIAPIFALFIVVIQFQISEKWHDKRTRKYKVTTKILFIVLLISTLATIFIVWIDDKKSSKLDDNLMTLQSKLTNDSVIQKKRDDSAIIDRKNLLKKISELQNQLEPFINIATFKFPQLNTDIGLTMLAKDIENQNIKIAAILNYSDVAKLNLLGKTGKVISPLIETTPISEMLKPVIIDEGNSVNYQCNQESYKIYHQLINKFPSYPFSYYFLAKCLYANHDNNVCLLARASFIEDG